MKRIFVRAGLTLVGLTAWLLPNQAKAEETEENCSVTAGGHTVTWSCPSDDLCRSTVTFSNGNVSIETSCA